MSLNKKYSSKPYSHPSNGSYTPGGPFFEHSLPDGTALNFASNEITWRKLFRSVFLVV